MLFLPFHLPQNRFLRFACSFGRLLQFAIKKNEFKSWRTTARIFFNDHRNLCDSWCDNFFFIRSFVYSFRNRRGQWTNNLPQLNEMIQSDAMSSVHPQQTSRAVIPLRFEELLCWSAESERNERKSAGDARASKLNCVSTSNYFNWLIFVKLKNASSSRLIPTRVVFQLFHSPFRPIDRRALSLHVHQTSDCNSLPTRPNEEQTFQR